jgi:penicillin-binding protein 1C
MSKCFPAKPRTVDPTSEQVVWYVDGNPFQLIDYPYTARWPLAPGKHRFQVRLPHTELVSNQVTVWIQ